LALADIIKARSNQDNFELIIITHDEELVVWTRYYVETDYKGQVRRHAAQVIRRTEQDKVGFSCLMRLTAVGGEHRGFYSLRREKDTELGAHVTRIEVMDFGE